MSVNETAAKIILKLSELSREQVFNADKTGLFWKKMFSHMFIAKSEKTASGFEVVKDLVAFQHCNNTSGASMLKHLIRNKSLKPHPLTGINVTEFPVHIMGIKKARITSAVFTTLFNDCFIPETEKMYD